MQLPEMQPPIGLGFPGHEFVSVSSIDGHFERPDDSTVAVLGIGTAEEFAVEQKLHSDMGRSTGSTSTNA